MRKSILILIVCLSTVSSAQEPQLTAETDSAQYKIGEWVLLRVRAVVPSAIQSIAPAVRDSIGPFEILNLETSDPTGRDGQREQLWTFRLTTFDSGKVFIPPLPFSYTTTNDTIPRTAMTNSVFLTITGVEVDPKSDIKDIKPPMDAPWRFEDFLPYLIALAVIALIAIVYFYYRRMKRRKEQAFVPERPVIPPALEALTALRLLEDKKLWQQGKVKEFYSEATEIIRRFLDRQFGILALESTSDEILRQLKPIPEAQSVMKQFVAFFTTADLVKFAKYEPSLGEHENELRWAYEFVRTMMPRIAPQDVNQEEETADVR